jgi:hypothetical protein
VVCRNRSFHAGLLLVIISVFSVPQSEQSSRGISFDSQDSRQAEIERGFSNLTRLIELCYMHHAWLK